MSDLPVTRDDDVPGPGEINVGAAAPRDLRLFLAKEAVRQAEARLTAQNGVRTALEARATAITGLASVGFLATVGAGFTATSTAVALGTAAAGLFLFTVGALGIIAARPRVWSLVGYEPAEIAALHGTLDTELEALETIGGGLGDGVTVNNKRINRMGHLLRWAGWLLLLAPVAGGLAYRLTPTLCAHPEAAAWVQTVMGAAKASDCPRSP